MITYAGEVRNASGTRAAAPMFARNAASRLGAAPETDIVTLLSIIVTNGESSADDVVAATTSALSSFSAPTNGLPRTAAFERAGGRAGLPLATTASAAKMIASFGISLRAATRDAARRHCGHHETVAGLAKTPVTSSLRDRTWMGSVALRLSPLSATREAQTRTLIYKRD